MKKSELKRALKPLIKECIREVILEESGVLSKVVSEGASGLATAAPTAHVVTELAEAGVNKDVEHEQYLQKLEEVKQQKQEMLNAIGAEAYGGIDIFEGTSPAPPQGDGRSPLSGRDPRDPGIDISNIMNTNSALWKTLAGNGKKGR